MDLSDHIFWDGQWHQLSRSKANHQFFPSFKVGYHPSQSAHAIRE